MPAYCHIHGTRGSNKTFPTAHRRYILGNRLSQVCASVESCGKSLVGPTGPMNVTISRQNIVITNSVLITLLKFALNTYPGLKMIGCMIKKDNFRAEKLAKSANYARSAFFRKYMKIMLLNRNEDGNYAKNYASTIHQSLFTHYALSFGPLSRAFSNRRVFDENA